MHSHDVHKVLDIDACWINTDGENIIFRAWHNRKTYLYNIGKCKLRVLNADGSNYLHYSNGYIYYDNIRLGGLWRQSVDDKSDKICISPAKVKRINTHGNTLIFQDEKKQTVMMEIDRMVTMCYHTGNTEGRVFLLQRLSGAESGKNYF